MSASRNTLVLYTGGTIGMVPSERGYVPSAELDRLMAAKMPEKSR